LKRIEIQKLKLVLKIGSFLAQKSTEFKYDTNISKALEQTANFIKCITPYKKFAVHSIVLLDKTYQVK
jgi:hypothetical protein